MTITVLASLFILVMLLVAVMGFKAVIRQGKSPQEMNLEKCSVCGQKMNKASLLERQVGDYRLLFFCASCINKLHNELISKN